MSYHEDEEDDDVVVDDDDDGMVEFDDDDDADYYMFDDSKEDDYLSMQAQFDNVDLPPGVEASFSWLNDDHHHHHPPPPPPPVAHESPIIPFCKTNNDIASTSSSVPPNVNSSSAPQNEDQTKEVKTKFEHFKSFDVVDDFSDHHFNNAGFQGQQVVFLIATQPNQCFINSLITNYILVNLFLVVCSLRRTGQRKFRTSGKY